MTAMLLLTVKTGQAPGLQGSTSASAPEKRAQRAHRFRGPVRHPRETDAQVLAAPTCASALGAVEGVKIGGRAASFGSRLGRI